MQSVVKSFEETTSVKDSCALTYSRTFENIAAVTTLLFTEKQKQKFGIVFKKRSPSTLCIPSSVYSEAQTS